MPNSRLQANQIKRQNGGRIKHGMSPPVYYGADHSTFDEKELVILDKGRKWVICD